MHLCFFCVNLRQIISALTDRWSSPPMSKYCCGCTRHSDSSDTCQSHMCYRCTGAGSGTVWCRFRSPDTYPRSDNGPRRFLHTRAHTNKRIGALIPGHIIKAHFNCSFSLFILTVWNLSRHTDNANTHCTGTGRQGSQTGSYKLAGFQRWPYNCLYSGSNSHKCAGYNLVL